MTYVLRLDDLARDHHAHTIAAALGNGSVPSWDVVKAAFDEDLAEPPEGERTDHDRSSRGIRLRALGMGR